MFISDGLYAAFGPYRLIDDRRSRAFPIRAGCHHAGGVLDRRSRTAGGKGRRDSARVEKRYRHREGHVVWTDLTASPIRDADGVPVFVVAVARLLDKWVATRGHLVARMGGDEFAILIDDPPEGELAMLADTVLAVLTEPIVIDEHRLVVSASIGVVECQVEETTPAEILKAADVTLYWAKSDGRNRWVRFDPERHARDMTRYTLSATARPAAPSRRSRHWPTWGCGSPWTTSAPATPTWDISRGSPYTP